MSYEYTLRLSIFARKYVRSVRFYHADVCDTPQQNTAKV